MDNSNGLCVVFLVMNFKNRSNLIVQKIGADGCLQLDDIETVFASGVNTASIDPYAIELGERFKRREILLNYEIDDEAVDLSMYILKWNLEDKDTPVDQRKPIKIYINTNGGDANIVFNLIDCIDISKTPVYTIALGKAYSAGALLLMAGHKRFVCRNTQCLIHDGITGMVGNTGKVFDNFEFSKRFENYVKEYVLSRTNITEELYEKNYRRDWFLFSSDILNLGIADEILSDIDTILI